MQLVKKTRFAPYFLIGIFILMAIWWVSIYLRGLVDDTENYYFGLAIGCATVFGGIIGLTRAKIWGYMQSYVGKAITLFSIGLMTWGLGTIIFAYYNLFLTIAVPYPSLADAAYIVSWPLWSIGVFYLSKATGAGFQLRTVWGKIISVIVVAIALIASYYLLFVVARGGTFDLSSQDYLKLFFDFAYPVGDIFILTLALLTYGLSFNYLGGRYKWPTILILLAFLLNYLADFSFTYMTTIGTFYVASWVDMIYTAAFFAFSLGVSFFNPLTHRNDA